MSQSSTTERLRASLLEVLDNFEEKLQNEDLREQVRVLVPAHQVLYDLGTSLLYSESARGRILEYLRRYPQQIIAGEELMVVAGISEWARRVRELRVQFGWSIVSGTTAREMAEEYEFPLENVAVEDMRPNDYILLGTTQDKKAAFRWNLANDIRKRSDLGMRDRLLLYLRRNVGEEVTGEELKYVAGKGSEWARRVRELRTEEGWPISTYFSGRPDLPIGVYVLEDDRQLPAHDRHIPERTRRHVLRRDDYKCLDCGWSHDEWNPSDPRHLELHHNEHHAQGGSNEAENLVTLCNVCHDERHASE